MTFAYFAGNIIVINLLLLHLILATILKSFYKNRDDEISKENLKKAHGNKSFVYEKLAKDDDDQSEKLGVDSDDSLSGSSGEELPGGNSKKRASKRASGIILGDNDKSVLLNATPNIGSSRSIQRFEDKLALKAEEQEFWKVGDQNGLGGGDSVLLPMPTGNTPARRLSFSASKGKKKQNMVHPSTQEETKTKDLFNKLGIAELCELRESYIRSKQGTFIDVYLKYETGKRMKNDIKKEDQSQDMFNFKAFEKCYMILNVRTFHQKLIYSLVYWWPVVVVEHALIITNCVYLCTYRLKSTSYSREVISWLNFSLTVYLLSVSALRIYLIKRASKSIKREYFIFLDIVIGLVAAVELLVGYLVNDYQLMPASVLMFMFVRVLMKAYATSISTSLKELISHANKTMKEIRYFIMILLIIILFFTFVGMSLYGLHSLPDEIFKRSRALRMANFSGFWRGLLTVFMVLTLEGWVTTFLEYRQKFGSEFVTVYFICLTLVVAIVMFKFLLSLIINNFLETSKKMEKMKRYKETSSKQDLTVDEQIYSKSK